MSVSHYIYFSMSKHSKIGIKGEQIAASFLLNKGYKILHTNWRAGKKEVDIIAQLNDLYIFVEVKTRSSTLLQFPEEAVTPRKQTLLHAAAAEYAAQHPGVRNYRFDIVSVHMYQDQVREITHFEEAF
jgi:putative endonuclease